MDSRIDQLNADPLPWLRDERPPAMRHPAPRWLLGQATHEPLQFRLPLHSSPIFLDQLGADGIGPAESEG
jgi:hypothetical protein